MAEMTTLSEELPGSDNGEHHHVRETLRRTSNDSKSSFSSPGGEGVFLVRRLSKVKMSAAVCFWVALCFLVVHESIYPSAPYSVGILSSPTIGDTQVRSDDDQELIKVLRRASTLTTSRGSSIPSKTVILTTLNSAWAGPGSILDLFLESFRAGNGTQQLMDNLVIVSLDHKAHQRCREIHRHCYAMATPGVNFTGDAFFMTEEYLLMMWRRIDFLASVLRHGFDFVFTDADILWFRNPFPHFHDDADFQIACDTYLGSASDRHNIPNGGFVYARSNDRTLHFYKYWYNSKDRFPGKHDQDVFNEIKFDPFLDGLRMRFLDTAYFGGFCQPVKDLNVAITMHANCCVGLQTKVHDLRNVLDDWKRFAKFPMEERSGVSFDWRSPRVRCRGW